MVLTLNPDAKHYHQIAEQIGTFRYYDEPHFFVPELMDQGSDSEDTEQQLNHGRQFR
jgi:hypothetical protein